MNLDCSAIDDLVDALALIGAKVGTFNQIEVVFGAAREGNSWKLFPQSALPNPNGNELSQLMRLIGEPYGEKLFAEQILGNELRTPRVIADMSVLRFPQHFSRAIVKFSAEVVISADGTLVGIWAKWDKNSRFIPLPSKTSVCNAGDLHAVISGFLSGFKVQPTVWQWLQQSRAPKRDLDKVVDWTQFRGKKRSSEGLFSRIAARLQLSCA